MESVPVAAAQTRLNLQIGWQKKTNVHNHSTNPKSEMHDSCTPLSASYQLSRMECKIKM